jgi:uncharacterized protein (TIGR03790 family)
MRRILLFLSLTLVLPGFAQTSTDYSDVAVIVNDNHTESQAIGLYFRQARNIPAINIIHISAPVTEIIDSTEFEIIRAQIAEYLELNDLVDSINYLVTTKGVPMRVERTFCSYFPQNAPMNCTTVESELALLFSADSAQISYPGSVTNPYFDENAPFAHAAYGTYLVTRLDGYTYEDVVSLIDRSGPNTSVNPNSAQHAFDIVNAQTAPDSMYFAQLCEESIQWLQSDGWITNFHPALTQLNYQQQIVDLVRYDYHENGSTPATLGFTPGSFAEILNTDWKFSFDPAVTQESNHLPSYIAAGLTGGHTYAYAIYFSQIMKHENFVERYFSGNYNLAEAAYASIVGLSSVNLVLGDPKSSVQPDFVTGLGDTQAPGFAYGPNPANELLTLVPGAEGIQSYVLYDATGRVMYSQTAEILAPDFISLSSFAAGNYLLIVNSGGVQHRARIIIQH